MKTSQPLQLKPGHCPFTNKKIVNLEERGGQMVSVKNKNYSEIWIQFDTGERMVVGIDKSIEKTKKNAKLLVELHVAYWKKGLENDADIKINQLKKDLKKNLDYYSKMKLLKHAINEKNL